MKNRFFMFITIVAIIGVASCASFKVVDVEWDTLEGPSKARQYLGISNSEVKVYAHYENGDRKLASAGSIKYDKDKVGVQTVTVTVGGTAGGSFETEVMELTGIGILSPPSKTSYKVGESLDTAGLKIKGMWRDMPEMEIPIFQLLTLAHSGYDSSTPGTKVITNTWRGKTATYTVSVRAADQPAPAQPSQQQPAAQQPSQPAAQQQQPAQQQPSTQQSSQSTFNPAPNQPSPVGRWNLNGNWYFTFNANGTGEVLPETPITWTASGNRLTINVLINGRIINTATYLYGITGNTLTIQAINNDGTVTGNPIITYTRQ
jgi:hypothetical protein